jgi:hypothetical protein
MSKALGKEELGSQLNISAYTTELGCHAMIDICESSRQYLFDESRLTGPAPLQRPNYQRVITSGLSSRATGGPAMLAAALPTTTIQPAGWVLGRRFLPRAVPCQIYQGYVRRLRLANLLIHHGEMVEGRHTIVGVLGRGHARAPGRAGVSVSTHRETSEDGAIEHRRAMTILSHETHFPHFNHNG